VDARLRSASHARAVRQAGETRRGPDLIAAKPREPQPQLSAREIQAHGEPEIYRHIKHYSLPMLLRLRLKPHGLLFAEARYYTHYTRLAKIGRAFGWPRILTEDLFVAAFRKI
jgi:hypothetical protein